MSRLCSNFAAWSGLRGQVEQPEVEPGQKRPPASNAWVPAAAGLILGGEVVKALCESPSIASFES